MTEALLRLYVIGSKNELKSADCFLSLSMREKCGMSKSKVWGAFKFIMRCTGMAILYLVFCIPYLPLILIVGCVAAFALVFVYLIFLELLGFWPAIIITILMVGHFFAKCRKEDQYHAELRTKEMRSEPLEPWEYKAIHPKPQAKSGFSNVIIGLVLGYLFFGNKE